MEWNVYRHDFNGKDIIRYNVFDHRSFSADVDRLLSRKPSNEELAKELKSLAMYYFWSKSEYEIIITSWPAYISAEELDRLNKEREEKRYYRHNVRLDIGAKIDIYDQLMMNWDAFVSYVMGDH